MEHLPDELVRQCLLRVPYDSHRNVKSVCKSWEAMLKDPKFYSDRKSYGKSQQLLCLIQSVRSRGREITIYDPVEGYRERLPSFDDPHCPAIPDTCECVAVNRKLVLLGGFHPANHRPLKNVYIYDFQTARWSRGADMPTLRCFFACCVSPSTGLIYVAGGHDRYANPLGTAECYDVEENQWKILPPMTQQRDGSQGIFFEGKLIVLSGPKSLQQHRFNNAEVLDPSTGTWRHWEHMWNLGGPFNSCLASSSSGDLYWFNDSKVRKYDSEKKVWTLVASFPKDIMFSTCATQWRDWIFAASTMKQSCYLFHPSSGQWNEVDVGKGFVESAASLEI